MHLITIVVPVFNEEKYIAQCLSSVLAFYVPIQWEIAEIFVCDGGSIDKTKEMAAQIAGSNSRIRLLPNPQRIQSTALNSAILQSSGDFIMRLDAHTIYPRNYLEECVKAYLTSDADNVGGTVTTMPANDSYSAQIVQALTTHPFGVGNSGFRTGYTGGKVDTVPFGFFKREVFKRVGLFDERLVRAQDYEMNRRISAAGGVVWLSPGINSSYYNQPSFGLFLKKQFLLEAPYNAYMWYLAPYSFAWRHSITLLFALGVLSGVVLWREALIRSGFIAVMGLYSLLAFASAVQQSLKYGHRLHLGLLPLSFFLFHLTHGSGVLLGIVRLLLGNSPIQKKMEPWRGAGRYRAWPLNV